jgi:hypothetical protein
MKIAMWSGPRNLSTAMMYAFAARGDCAVRDEPFYAPYLAATGMDHPLSATVLAAHDSDAASVARHCAGPVPDSKKLLYMKHMPHHMLPGFPLDWAADCVNAHLIRHPARVIASYVEKRAEVTLHDIGFQQQFAIWQRFPGPVLDGGDIRANPLGMLQKLCAELGIPFVSGMLHWPAGPKPYDGAWGPHWYNAVHRSTGFADPEGDLPAVAAQHQPLLDAALPIYEAMRAIAINV